MSIHIRGIGPIPAPADDGASSQNPQGPFGPQGHHHHKHHVHQAQKSGARARSKRKRGADSQDGIDESGASEELLMMLTEHLQKEADLVMRVAERHSGERGGSEADPRDGGDENGSAASAQLKRTGSGKRFLRTADHPEQAIAAFDAAESALLEARRAQGEARPAMSSTYRVLAVMRDFLAVPGTAARASATLALIRERLVAAVGTPTRRAPEQQESINLLLPLMLLNLERARTDTERALAVAKISSLIERRRSYV
jgi:type III secretion regulatory protein HpaA